MLDSQTLAEAVAAEVRAEMGRKGVSAAALAAQLKVSEMYLSRRLSVTRDRIPLDLADLERIATALGVSVMCLLPATVTAAAA